MTQPHLDQTEISVIRFTRRLTGQCPRQRSRLFDWVVCDTIVNGARFRVGRRGTRRGIVVRFERTFPGARPDQDAIVQVLGELTRGGCFALQLLLPARNAGKIWDNSGFLNRAGSK